MNRRTPDQHLFSSVILCIDQHALLGKNERVLVAVSGGADSVALLHVMHSLSAELGITLGVGHVNHTLRGEESDGDARFVADLSDSLGIPFHIETKDVRTHRKTHGLSLEEAAREARYDALFSMADRHGYTRIATAHHGGDNAELVLMNLLRGSGPSGLGGMSPTGHGGRVIRPFIETDRSDILDFLSSMDIAFRTDSSNSDTAFTRNRIRHELIPSIEKNFQPEILRILGRTARIIRDEDEWMDRFAAQALENACIGPSENGLDLSIPVLSTHPPALVRRIIRLAVGRVKSDIRGFSLTHIESVLALIASAPRRASLDLPGRIRVLKNGGRLTVRREAGPLRLTPPWESASPAFDYRIDRPMKAPQALLISETGHRLVFSELSRREIDKLPFPETRTAVLDLDRLDFPLKVRNITPGDRFTPLGMNGTMKVSRFFNTVRLGRNERLTCPLVLSGADIVWVCGHRIADPFKITPRTENVLKIELFLD